MKKTKWYKKATQMFPDAKISRVALFYKDDNTNTIYIKNYDENVVTIVNGKDLSTLLYLIPSDIVIDRIRYEESQKTQN